MSAVVDELRALMKAHRLTRPEAARRMQCSKVAVDSWLAPADASIHRAMPSYRLDLLRASLAADPPAAKEAAS